MPFTFTSLLSSVVLGGTIAATVNTMLEDEGALTCYALGAAQGTLLGFLLLAISSSSSTILASSRGSPVGLAAMVAVSWSSPNVSRLWRS